MVEQSKPLLFFLVGLASLFIIISGIRDLSFILSPILLSVVITIAVLPLPGWFGQRGVPGWLSLILTFLVVLAVIGLVLLILFLGMAQLSGVLAGARMAAASDSASFVGDPGMQFDQLTAAIKEFISSQQITALASKLVSGLFSTLSQAFLVMLIFAFMLSSALTLPSSSRLGLRTDHPLLVRAATLTADVRRYVTLTTMLNFATGLCNAILLWVIGVDLALLWGVLSGLLGYIPVVGFWVAMIPPMILAYLKGGLPLGLVVLAGYALINGTVENLVKPRMLGQRLKISPAVVVIALFVWGWLLGAVGAILSTPLTLLALSIMEGFDGTRWMTVLLRTAGLGDKEEQAEREAAVGRVRGLWGRATDLIRSGSGSKPVAEPPGETAPQDEPSA